MSTTQPGQRLAAPDTTTNASTSEPKLICQLKPDKPCDVDKIMVEVTGVKVGHPDPVTRKLEITTSHRRREHAGVEDFEVRRMLRREYDVLIDIIADVKAPNFRNPKGAKIGGKGFYHGRSCPTHSHAELELKPLGGAPELGDKREIVIRTPGATMLEMPVTEIYAPRSFIDVSANQAGASPFDEVTNVFGIITMLWHMNDAKVVELVARSCGRRAKEDRKAANLDLRAGVRVFRNSKLTAGISIPSLGSFSRVRERDYAAGTYKVDTTVSAGGNAVRQESRQTNHDDGRITAVRERQIGGTVTQDAYEGERIGDQTFGRGYSNVTLKDGEHTSSTYGLITRDDVKDRLKRAHGFEVILTHNGTEVKVLDAIARMKSLIEEIGKAITDIKNIVNAAPQIGWKFTFDVSVFTGSILLEWYPDYVDQPLANGRYLAVEWKLDGKIQIEIFNIMIEASFGVDARAVGSGIVVKVAGSIDGKASVDANINLNLAKARQDYGVATEANATLRVVGHASIFGKTIADAELKGTGGVELVDGKLDVQWDKRTCDLTGRVELKPVIITGYVRGIIWDSELDPVQVMERKRLFDFT